MGTKQPEALRIAEWLEGIRGNTWPSYIPQEAAAELRRQHAEIETLRAGYDAARLEIASLRERVQQLGQLARDVNSRRVTELEAQLAAVGAGGVEPLRKRECLHQITEPVQPLVCDYCGALTPDPWHSSGMMNGKMSKHIHSCDACAAPAQAARAAQAEPEDLSVAYFMGLHAAKRAPQPAAQAQVAAPIKTLEEAIAHAKEKAKGGSACAYEHAKLTAWLTELQLLRAARTAPAQAGEHPPLPKPDIESTQVNAVMRYTALRSFSASQMYAYADAACAARGARTQERISAERIK